MISFDVRLDPSYRQVQRWIRTMPDKVVDKATVRTLNRLLRVSNTHAARNISKPTGLKNKYIKKWIRMDKARRGKWEARLRIMDTYRVPMNNFKYKKGSLVKNGRKYQRIRFTKSYINAYARTAGISGKVFQADMGSGHTGLFKRKGRGRLPIEKPKGPRMGDLWKRFGAGPVQRELSTRYLPEMEKNLNYYMARHRARR